MPFGISLSDFAILAAVIFFYLGFSVFSIALGIYNGQITSKAEVLARINPIKSLDVYNQWFLDSYKQMKSTDSVAVRNAYFGMLISGMAILVLWFLVYAIIKIPLGDEPISQSIAILGSGLFFYLIGGFNAFAPVFADAIGLFPLSTLGNATVGGIVLQRQMKGRRPESRMKSGGRELNTSQRLRA